MADTCNVCMSPYGMPKRLAAESGLAISHEYLCALMWSHQFRPRFMQISLQPGHGLLSQRNQAFFASFAQNTHDALVQIHLPKFQRNQFTDPQTRGIHQFQHGAVAQAKNLAGIRAFNQRRNLPLAQCLGQAPAQFGAFNEDAGIVCATTFAQLPLVKLPESGKVARQGTGVTALLHLRCEKTEYVFPSGSFEAQSAGLQVNRQ